MYSPPIVHIPWGSHERLLLAEAVEAGESWEKICMICKRDMDDCRFEYSQILLEYGHKHNTPKKIAEVLRAERIEYLRKKVKEKEDILIEMNKVMENCRGNEDVRKVLKEIPKEPRSALYKAGVLNKRLRDNSNGRDDFGRYEAGAQRKQRKTLAHEVEEVRQPVPFEFVGKMSVMPSPDDLQKSKNLTMLEQRGGSCCSMKHLLSAFENISSSKSALLFQDPVTDIIAPGYSTFVKQPMCLSVIRTRLHDGTITTVQQMYRELMLMLSNACLFNLPGSDVHKCAIALKDVVTKECEPLMISQILSTF